MNMGRLFATMSIFAATLAPGAASVAQTFTYIGKDAPLFTVTVPDGWEISVGAAGSLEAEIPGGRTVSSRLVECSPGDRPVWFGLWSVEGVADLDAAQSIAASVETEFISEPRRLRAPKDFSVAGMPMRTIEGVAKVEGDEGETNAVAYTTVLFQVSKTVVGVGTYLSEPGDEERNARDLAAMIASLRAISR